MFVYFWVPTDIRFDCELGNFKKSIDISDNVENQKNILTIEVQENKDINIEYGEKEYILRYITHTSKGLFIYEYDNNIDEKLLTVQIYHIFKDICHIHKSHNDEEDSLLKAYISDKDKDIDKAIAFYCELYIDKFKSYENTIMDFMNQSTNDFNYEDIKQKKKLLTKAKGEILYSFFISDGTKFKKVFESFDKNFDILSEKLDIQETDKLFKLNNVINKWQLILAILGIIITVVGTILTIVSMIKS